MQLAKKISNLFSTTGRMKPADRQGIKKDILRKRTGKKEYIEHAKHVLEKTQTEAFLEFQAIHPDIKIKQRKFESLKPFFKRAAKERDRRSCLCGKHVEAQIVFKDCMKFRKMYPEKMKEMMCQFPLL